MNLHADELLNMTFDEYLQIVLTLKDKVEEEEKQLKKAAASQ